MPLMLQLLKTPTDLIVVACLVVTAGIASAQGPVPDHDAHGLGWRIYQEARLAAGTGPAATPIHDYSHDLLTRLKTPKGDAEVRSTVYFLTPGLIRQEMETPGGKAVIIFDGEKVWRALAGEVQQLPAEAVQQIRSDLARSHVLLSPAPNPEAIRYLSQDEVEGRAVDVIQISDVGGTPLRLFVDAQSRGILKKIFVGDVPGGGMAQVEELYSDFREVAGYRWPHRRQVWRNGKLALDSTLLNLRVNIGLEVGDITR